MARSDSLSVPEMLRIMDVATTLRLDRELVEEQLNLDALKDRLQERMLAASKVTGEAVTPEEVDAAIQKYYAGLYTFREPKLTFPVFLAHLWVRRKGLLGLGAAAMVLSSMLWWLYLSPGAPMTGRGRNHRRVEALASGYARRDRAVRAGPFGKSIAADLDRLDAEAEISRQKDDPRGIESARKALDELENRAGRVEKSRAEISGRAETIRAITLDKKVAPEVDRLLAEAEVHARNRDLNGLASVRDSIAVLESRLREEYAVTVVARNTVSGANKNSIVRHKTEEGRQIADYYLFVQARRPDGSVIPRRVHNLEDDKYKEVTTWAERIPEEVYERLKKDKLEDGILNETAFAVKRPGYLDEEITMPGADGKPIARMGQITEW